MRVVSGIQPTGKLHLGNYLGTVQTWKQHSNACYAIVDYHAISTLYFDQKDSKAISRELNESIYTTAAYLMAWGIPQSTLFVQSAVVQHTELMWVLASLAPMHWFQRMTQFKVKKEKLNGASLGLFAYPALMAADVLLYKGEAVPVGDDQVQHLELARNIAVRFNSRFETNIFPIPQILHTKAKRVMSLRNAEVKMSKSGSNDADRINLEDTPDLIATKISKAKTDSHGFVSLEQGSEEVKNLTEIYSALSNEPQSSVEGLKMPDFKRKLTEVLIETLHPIRTEAQDILKDRGELGRRLQASAETKWDIAVRTMREVRSHLGFLNQTIAKPQMLYDLIWYLGFFGILFKLGQWLMKKAKVAVSLEQFAYGWVVITGASDGIGKAMVQYLAKLHYKLVLVARNEEKLSTLVEELKVSTGNENIEYVVCDFSKSHRDATNFYNNLMQQLEKFEVSVLINNVGVAANGNFHSLSQETMETLIGVNCYPQTMLSYHFLKIFEERFKTRLLRSCMINLSSSSSFTPVPLMALYGATKVFNDFLSRNITQSHSASVTCVSITPFGVKTPLADQMEAKDWLLVSADSYAEAVFANLHEETTAAHFSHKIQEAGVKLMPESWLPRIAEIAIKLSKK